MNEEKTYALGDNCDIKDHRPCELNTALGMAQRISPTDKLNELAGRRYTESELMGALQEARDVVPEQHRARMDRLLQIVGPGTD